VGRRQTEQARRVRGEVSIAGRAKIAVPALVAAACAAFVAAFLIRGEDRAPTVASPVERQAASSASDLPAGSELARTRSSVTPEGAAPEVAAATIPKPRPASLHPGVIRGEVLTDGGAVVPERWTLHVGPHPWLAGHETAADRRIELEHGESTFEVRDLPLGGYIVEALAPGANCLPGNVMLVQGSEDQFVSIQLSPAGFLDGGVLDSAGRPAEGLYVTLESVATGERRSLSTDAAGLFLFREVRDGEYRLFFGRPDSPLLPPQSLLFQAPSLRFPTRTLPPSVSIEVSVVDILQRPVPGARVSGSAPEGGAIDTRCDGNGIARIRFVPPGNYRIDAHGDGAFRGSAVIVLSAGQPEAKVRIIVRDGNERRG
jgi:hypothetical protein